MLQFGGKPWLGKKTHNLGTASEELRWGERTYVMGVINATPDSFSGDGVYDAQDHAVRKARTFIDEGADILDIGGESTRPGSLPVDEEEELRRVLPVVRAVSNTVALPVSVDTSKSGVAQAALASGAGIINDVWGLKRDPRIAEVAAASGAFLVLMHNQEGTEYRDLIADILTSLEASISRAEKARRALAEDHRGPGIRLRQDG